MANEATVSSHLQKSSLSLNDGIKEFPSGQSSVAFATFNLVKALIAAGIFTGPEAMLISGYFGMIILVILCTTVMFITSKIVLHLAARYNVSSYSGVSANIIGGRWGKKIEDIFSFLLTFGSMVSYALISSSSLSAFLTKVSGWKSGQLISSEFDDMSGIGIARVMLDRRILIAIVAVVILYPLNLLPSIHFLSYSSVFGLFCFILIFISLSQRALTLPEEKKGTLPTSEVLSIFHIRGIPSAIARATFMNVLHHFQFLILYSLKKNTPRNHNIVLITSLGISTVSIIVFCSLTYIPLNNKITGDIFNSFSEEDVLISVCRLALAFHLLASFCINGHACRFCLLRLFHGERTSYKKLHMVFYSTIITAVTVLIACVVCDLGVIVDLTGSLAAGAISIIIPSIFWILVNRRDGTGNKWKFGFFYFLAIFGVALVIYSVVIAIYDGINPSKSSTVCPYTYLGNVK